VARSDLLLNLVKAGLNGEQELFTRTVEAVIAEERAKHHHVLADSLAQATQQRKASRDASVHVLLRTPCAELLLEQQPDRTLSELVLPAVVQTIASQLIEEQQRADLLRSYNLEPRSRMLLIGPPGNGKTSLAEAIATALAVPFLVVRYEKVVNSYLGETAKRLQEVFQYARMRQCVLFFDEFDALGKEREDRQESGEIKRVLNSLLLEVDRLPSYVILIAATNHPELLDRAVWRRFQIRATLPLPDREQIGRWFELLGSRFPQLGFSNAKRLYSRLVGASYSELQDLAHNVLRRRVLDGETDSDRIFQEQVKLWTLNHPKRGIGQNEYATDSNLSNARNGRQSKEGQRTTGNPSANVKASERTSRTANPEARTGIRRTNRRY
jgi:SpoVK/Ycf46/Vps4 family AAA+-type ATPase